MLLIQQKPKKKIKTLSKIIINTFIFFPNMEFYSVDGFLCSEKDHILANILYQWILLTPAVVFSLIDPLSTEIEYYFIHFKNSKTVKLLLWLAKLFKN